MKTETFIAPEDGYSYQERVNRRMTKKQTDKLYDDIIKKLHIQYRLTYTKQHFYKEINMLLESGVPKEDVEWYFTVHEAINAVRETRIASGMKYGNELSSDSEIKEWWKKVYEVLGVNPKELTNSINTN